MTTIYESTIPVIMHKLGNLKHILEIGAKHAAASEIDEAALTGFRLFPDMLSFRQQIFTATDVVCGCTARLTGNQRLSLDDGATSFAQLIARIDATLEHLNAQNPDDYAGAENKHIQMKTPFGELNFTGAEYLAHFLFPNLYFHMTTAYNMLRHNGVQLSKVDYLRGSGDLTNAGA